MKKREGGKSIWAISPRKRQPGASNLCDETSSTVAGMAAWFCIDVVYFTIVGQKTRR